MGDHFAVGIALELAALCGQLFAKLAKVLDDAVVDQREFGGRMGVRIGSRRRAVGGPAGVGDASGAGCGITRQFEHQIAELARRASADQLSAIERADTGRIIAAIFHAAQAIDETLRNLILANDADNSTHGLGTPCLEGVGNPDAGHLSREILCISCNQDAMVNLRRSQNNGVGEFQSRAFSAQRGCMRSDLQIDLVDGEPIEEDFDITQRFAALFRHDLDPRGSADPWLIDPSNLGVRGAMAVECIDQDVAVEGIPAHVSVRRFFRCSPGFLISR